MRSFLLVLLLLLAPALYLYSAENPPSPQGQTNQPANQSLGDDPPVTVEPPSLQQRAEQGDVEAQYNLALKYELGVGVPQDYVTDYAWANIAAAQGDDNAKRNRDLAAAELDAGLLGEAQKLSKDYFKRYVEPFQ